MKGSRIWWAAAVGWWVLVSVGWAGWFGWRAWQIDEAARAAASAAAAWRARVDELNSIPPEPAPPRAVEAARLLRDVEALSFERASDADRARARAYIAHELTALGWSPALSAFAGGVNIVCDRPGIAPGAGSVLLGAHFDTVRGSPGADDNASGVALLLEVARRLAGKPTPLGLRLVVFDGEERGLAGSAVYAADPERVRDLVAAVVIEMVGYTCDRPGCQRAPTGMPPGLVPDRGDFLGVVGDLEHASLLGAFKRAAGPGRPPVRVLPVPARGAELPDTRRSDHAPFWDAGVGAVMVTDTGDLRNPNYHLPTDTPDTLDPEFLRGSTEVVLGALAELLAGPGGATPRGAAPPPPRSTP